LNAKVTPKTSMKRNSKTFEVRSVCLSNFMELEIPPNLIQDYF
jgi:hypothetical protein